MSSINRTGRSKKAPRHVRLYHWMMESAAWQSLNGNQRAIYVEMAARYMGSNNGRIPFGVRDAARALRISKATASREMAVLQECGFIVPTFKGAFSLKTKQATEWRLTEFCDDRIPGLPTKDFMRWRPENFTVSPQASTVPVAKLFGTSGETEPPKNGPDGTCGETVAPKSAAPRFHERYTSKLPSGGVAASADAADGAVPPETRRRPRQAMRPRCSRS